MSYSSVCINSQCALLALAIVLLLPTAFLTLGAGVVFGLVPGSILGGYMGDGPAPVIHVALPECHSVLVAKTNRQVVVIRREGS